MALGIEQKVYIYSVNSTTLAQKGTRTVSLSIAQSLTLNIALDIAQGIVQSIELM